MSKPSTIRRGVLAAIAGFSALSAAAVAPQVAAAQPYGYGPPPSYSDVGRSARSNRTALGALRAISSAPESVH